MPQVVGFFLHASAFVAYLGHETARSYRAGAFEFYHVQFVFFYCVWFGMGILQLGIFTNFRVG